MYNVINIRRNIWAKPAEVVDTYPNVLKQVSPKMRNCDGSLVDPYNRMCRLIQAY